MVNRRRRLAYYGILLRDGTHNNGMRKKIFNNLNLLGASIKLFRKIKKIGGTLD